MAKKHEQLTIDELLSNVDVTEKLKVLSYEDGVELLDTLVQQVEEGTLTLDVSLRAYERGSLLLQHIRSLLEGAEAKLELIKKGSDLV